MKAIAVQPSRQSVGLVDHPAPEIASPTAVELRMLEVGVCGTDREIAAMQYGTPPPGSDHLILGHESLGQVVEVGPAVTRVRPGDLVVPTVRRPCPHEHCVPCRTGQQDFCVTGDFTERGIKEAHGYLAERVVDEERYMIPVPARLRDVAVLVEPLTIAEKALRQVRLMQERLPWSCELGKGISHECHRAVVLGAGPVGLLGAMALCAEGFDTWVYSRGKSSGERAGLIEAFGGHFVPAEEVEPEQLAEVVGSIDLIYEAMGASQASFRAMQALGVNGVFVFTGVPGRKAKVEIDTDLLMRNLVLKNQVVLGTVNAGAEAFEQAIADLETFLARWPDALHRVITGRYPLQKAPELLLGKGGGIKNVITVAAEGARS